MNRALWAILALVAGCASCGDPAAPAKAADSSVIFGEGQQLTQCQTTYQHDRAGLDKCRADTKAFWDKYWANHFADAGAGQ